MKYEPFNIKNALTKDRIIEFGMCNPYQALNDLFKKHSKRSFDYDLPYLHDIHPQQVGGLVRMSEETMTLINNYLKLNPTSQKSAYSFWIKKVKSIQCTNRCVTAFNKGVDSMILENIEQFIKFRIFTEGIDCDSAVNNIANNRLKSLILEILDSFVDNGVTLKFVVGKILKVIESTMALRSGVMQVKTCVLEDIESSDDEKDVSDQSDGDFNDSIQ